MKAIRLHDGNELLYESNVPTPSPGPNDLLLRIHATAIIAPELTWPDTHTSSSGTPRPLPIPGHDLSGTIVALGDSISPSGPYKIGGEVFALTAFRRDGAEAEYSIALPSEVAPKPRTLNHVQAAAVPLSALTVWQALFDHAGLDPHDHDKNKGKRVLITGAAGGVGVFAVQLAHWAGVHVIGTGSTRNIDFIRSLGADEAVDYTAVSLTDAVQDVDVVLDCVGGDTLTRCWDVVKQNGGVLISVAEPASLEVAKLHPGVKRVWFIVSPNGEQLGRIGQLVDEGVVRPEIETVMRLEDASKAFELGKKGHTRGKIVLKVSEDLPD
jgi:NADPH:quinone reductase-like Zn-dependent oxidoreductase